MYTVKSEDVFVEGEIPRKKRWKEFLEKIRKVCNEHRNECLMAITALSMIIRPICRTIRSVFGTAKKEKLMKNSVYDRSEGHHWFLRRTPNNAEWYEINNRRKNGERLGDILASMHLLK